MRRNCFINEFWKHFSPLPGIGYASRPCPKNRMLPLFFLGIEPRFEPLISYPTSLSGRKKKQRELSGLFRMIPICQSKDLWPYPTDFRKGLEKKRQVLMDYWLSFVKRRLRLREQGDIYFFPFHIFLRPKNKNCREELCLPALQRICKV